MATMVDIPWFIFAASIFVIVSGIAFIWMMRRTGISMGSYDTEEINCPMTVNSSVLMADEGFSLRTRKSFVLCMRLSYPPATLAFLAGCILAPPWQISFIGVILFGAGSIFCWFSDWIGFYVYADGISPKSCIETLFRKTDCRKRLVLWSEVTSCQIVTVHNKYEKFVRRYPVLKDAQGKFIFDGSCSYACQEDLDRLVALLKGT